MVRLKTSSSLRPHRWSKSKSSWRPKSERGATWRSSLLIICMAALGKVGAQERISSCLRVLKISDQNGDGLLSHEEFSVFLRKYTSESIVDSIPTALQSVFTSYERANDKLDNTGIVLYADGSTNASVESKQFCGSINKALVDNANLDITFDQCLAALDRGDSQDPLGYLSKDGEYSLYLEAIAGHPLSTASVFESLPAVARDAFTDMAIDGRIHLLAESDYIFEFCKRSSLAWTFITKYYPEASVEGKRDLSEDSIDFTTCVAALQKSDTQDPVGSLSKDGEYVIFLEALSGQTFAARPTFDGLPNELKNPFQEMAEDNQIVGSKGADYLLEFCNRAFSALSLVDLTSLGENAESPSVRRERAGVEFDECVAALQEGDTKSPVGSLTKDGEYSDFLEALSGQSFAAMPTYASLPVELQKPFDEMAENEQIVGAKGPDYILEFCNLAFAALTQIDLSSLVSSAGVLTHVDVDVDFEDCVAALQQGDTQDPKGSLSKDGEYGVFLEALSGQSFVATPTFGRLPTPLQEVYMEMAVDNLIPSSLGSEYLLDFCNRASSALSLIDRTPATLAPTGSTLVTSTSTSTPTLQPTNMPTLPDAPTRAPVPKIPTPLPTIESTDEPTYLEPTPLPTYGLGSYDMSKDAFKICKRMLLVSDTDRNDRLSVVEFSKFVDRLGDKDINVSTYLLDQTYKKLQQGGAESLSVKGSKPGSNPTQKELANLKYICEKSYAALAAAAKNEEHGKIDVQASALTSQGVNSDEVDFESFFVTCKTAMLMSDKTQDSFLSKDEFSKLIVRLASNDLQNGAFEDIDPIFQDTYKELATGRGLDIRGTGINDSPTSGELDSLRSSCSVIQDALDLFAQKHSVNPISASDLVNFPNNIDLYPNLSDETYRACLMAMFVADANRDDKISKHEFSELVKRITYGVESGKSFEELDEPYRIVFAQISNRNGKIDITGSRVGNTPTEEQDRSLRSICNAIQKNEVATQTNAPTESPAAAQKLTSEPSIDQIGSPFEVQGTPSDNMLDSSLTPVASTTAAPLKAADDAVAEDFDATNASSSNGAINDSDEGTGSSQTTLLYTKFKKCKTEMLKADQNIDEYLDMNEFYPFVISMAGTPDADSFSSMAPVFQELFFRLAKDRESFKVEGTSLLQKPTERQNNDLKLICVQVYDAIDRFTNPEPHQDCISSMIVADKESNGLLTENEYVDFLNSYTHLQFEDETFDDLPFFLRESFGWTKSYGGNLDFRNSRKMGTYEDETAEFCQRIEKAVAEGNFQTTLTDHCAASLASIDIDENGLLTASEFLSLVNSFTGDMFGSVSFEMLHPILQEYFDASLDVDTAGEESEVAAFCLGLNEAIFESQHDIQFLHQCKEKLKNADSNRDGLLGEDEFAALAYNVTFCGLTEDQLSQILFDRLDPSIQLSFSVLAGIEEAIDVSGILQGNESRKNDERLEAVCREVQENTKAQVKSSTTLAHSSFIIATQLQASETRSSYEHAAFEKAYSNFVTNITFLALPSRRERKLTTVLGTVPSSGSIYRIEDTDCPMGIDDASSSCQIMFGSFELLVLDSVDSSPVVQSMETSIQQSIDDGKLQEAVIEVDDSIALKVVKSSFPIVPLGNETESDIIRDPDSIYFGVIQERGSVVVLGFTCFFAIVLLVCGLYYGNRLRQRQRDASAEIELKSTADEDEFDTDDEEDEGLSDEEKDLRRRERKLRASIVPLLLTQSYHLPGYNYGEDLFQYIFNSHPVFGICWHHPAHPVGLKIRIVSLFGSMLFGLAVSNIIFLAFVLSDSDFDESFLMKATEGALTGKASIDDEVLAAAANISNGNLALWTIGSALHAVYDSFLWYVAAGMFCVKGGKVQKMERYTKVGSMAVVLSVAIVAVMAMVTVGIRSSIKDQNVDHEEIREQILSDMQLGAFLDIRQAKYSFFLTAYAIEMCTTYFFYYPMIGWILFSGCFRCIHNEYFGGRPYEVMLEERDARREKRTRNRKRTMSARLKRDESQMCNSSRTLATCTSEAFGESRELTTDGSAAERPDPIATEEIPEKSSDAKRNNSIMWLPSRESMMSKLGYGVSHLESLLRRESNRKLSNSDSDEEKSKSCSDSESSSSSYSSAFQSDDAIISSKEGRRYDNEHDSEQEQSGNSKLKQEQDVQKNMAKKRPSTVDPPSADTARPTVPATTEDITPLSETNNSHTHKQQYAENASILGYDAEGNPLTNSGSKEEIPSHEQAHQGQQHQIDSLPGQSSDRNESFVPPQESLHRVNPNLQATGLQRQGSSRSVQQNSQSIGIQRQLSLRSIQHNMPSTAQSMGTQRQGSWHSMQPIPQSIGMQGPTAQPGIQRQGSFRSALSNQPRVPRQGSFRNMSQRPAMYGLQTQLSSNSLGAAPNSHMGSQRQGSVTFMQSGSLRRQGSLRNIQEQPGRSNVQPQHPGLRPMNVQGRGGMVPNASLDPLRRGSSPTVGAAQGRGGMVPNPSRDPLRRGPNPNAGAAQSRDGVGSNPFLDPLRRGSSPNVGAPARPGAAVAPRSRSVFAGSGAMAGAAQQRPQQGYQPGQMSAQQRPNPTTGNQSHLRPGGPAAAQRSYSTMQRPTGPPPNAGRGRGGRMGMNHQTNQGRGPMGGQSPAMRSHSAMYRPAANPTMAAAGRNPNTRFNQTPGRGRGGRF